MEEINNFMAERKAQEGFPGESLDDKVFSKFAQDILESQKVLEYLKKEVSETRFGRIAKQKPNYEAQMKKMMQSVTEMEKVIGEGVKANTVKAQRLKKDEESLKHIVNDMTKRDIIQSLMVVTDSAKSSPITKASPSAAKPSV